MSKASIGFTYSVVTPESAEYGDVADHGFCDPKGWKYSMYDNETYKDIMTNKQDYSVPYQVGDLRQAVNDALSLGISQDCGSWFSTTDGHINYATGGSTEYCLHVEGISNASYKRLARYLAGKNVFGK